MSLLKSKLSCKDKNKPLYFKTNGIIKEVASFDTTSFEI